MTAAAWRLNARRAEFVEHLGAEALFLEQGRALVNDLEFARGVIEFDVAFGEARGFVGLVFHMSDAANYEHFYLRPHQSGNPDASQYQPVVNGHASWQLCYGPDFAAPLVHRFDAWQHVRVVVAEQGADIYVDSAVPVLRVRPLLHGARGGAIGLSANTTPAWFANFSVDRQAELVLSDGPLGDASPRPGLIEAWAVSSAFDGDLLNTASDALHGPSPDGQPDAQQDPKSAARSNAPLDLEVLAPTRRVVNARIRGIANLAEAVEPGGPRTVLARAWLHADRARRVELELGYSDRAALYLNGELLFRGNQTYRAQDYRFLGTIGLYDTLVLPLRAGTNELAVAVTEDFGGWGITARVTPTPGVRVEPAR
ncbi:MAG: hypothetical protein DHS20C15_13810 [Planctomycetota bacterium]|nr:MAG: hypothetical protein DHS20C15_13810 [Planctomycetota bacterium]